MLVSGNKRVIYDDRAFSISSVFGNRDESWSVYKLLTLWDSK